MFGTKTVDSVIKQFNKVVTDLEEVMKNCEAEEEKQARIIEEATASLRASKHERKRAASVSQRIRSLVNGPEDDKPEQVA